MLTKSEQDLIDGSRGNPELQPVSRAMDLVLSRSRDWLRIEAQHETTGAAVAQAGVYVLGQIIVELSLTTGVAPSAVMAMVANRMKQLGEGLEGGGYAVKKGSD